MKEWDVGRCYEILELKPGASEEEVKQAYKDLVKVWHPDRFAHDPRLQEKAQEKLKEINQAYEQLRSSRRTGFRWRDPWSGSRPPHNPPSSGEGSGKLVCRFPSWLSVLITLVIFLSLRVIPVRLIGILLILFFFILFFFRSIRDTRKR